MVVIVDYRMGNLGSILNMLKSLEVPAKISSNRKDLMSADKLILPGVGSFDNGMSSLTESGMIDILNDLVLDSKKPILGICLGMQLMTAKSEEGKLPGLGYLDAETKRFNLNACLKLRIPHMGWNSVRVRKESRLLEGLPADARFYFVHSYYVSCRDPNDILSETNYGFDFASAVGHGNIFGTQFHPEKSHKFGKIILGNFAGME
jgi:glutamine amidotransferase